MQPKVSEYSPILPQAPRASLLTPKCGAHPSPGRDFLVNLEVQRLTIASQVLGFRVRG